MLLLSAPAFPCCANSLAFIISPPQRLAVPVLYHFRPSVPSLCQHSVHTVHLSPFSCVRPGWVTYDFLFRPSVSPLCQCLYFSLAPSPAYVQVRPLLLLLRELFMFKFINRIPECHFRLVRSLFRSAHPFRLLTSQWGLAALSLRFSAPVTTLVSFRLNKLGLVHDLSF